MTTDADGGYGQVKPFERLSGRTNITFQQRIDHCILTSKGNVAEWSKALELGFPSYPVSLRREFEPHRCHSIFLTSWFVSVFYCVLQAKGNAPSWNS